MQYKHYKESQCNTNTTKKASAIQTLQRKPVQYKHYKASASTISTAAAAVVGFKGGITYSFALTLRKSTVSLTRHTLPLKSGRVCMSASSLTVWLRHGGNAARRAVMIPPEACQNIFGQKRGHVGIRVIDYELMTAEIGYKTPQVEHCLPWQRRPVVCVSSHSFWTSMDVPAGVTQEEGHTGFFIHLPFAVRALL